ncbi:MAG: hypothetical protein HDQ96_09150 [Lachnospiraceae bacterium]|nr:hypothetical protein [Lachnospiraceae bacterium]
MDAYQLGYQIGAAFAVGLIPLFVGLKMGDRLLGIIGLIGCIVSGLIGMGGALLPAIIFVIVILIRNK